MKCRGRCVIINISQVIGLPARNGSEQDVKLINELFVQLHFVVEIYSDLTSHVSVPLDFRFNELMGQWRTEKNAAWGGYLKYRS